jgi:chromatin structure-remodeling complex subunit RSC1/2
MDIVSSATVAKKQLSHSLKYLAAKAAREEQRKRLREEEQEHTMAIDIDEQQPPKRARLETETEVIDPSRVTALISKTVSLLARNITTGTSTFYKNVYTNQKTAEEYQTADTRQREHDIKTFTLAKNVADEIKAATIDEYAPRATDFRRGGVYLEDVN